MEDFENRCCRVGDGSFWYLQEFVPTHSKLYQTEEEEEEERRKRVCQAPMRCQEVIVVVEVRED